jgi:hypothetical protein
VRALKGGGGSVMREMCRCPGGSTRAGNDCVNVNECLASNPCLHGGSCVDREPARRYDCHCALGYTGHDCELKLLASGFITPSRDFIIAIIVCLFVLLGKTPFISMHAFTLFSVSAKFEHSITNGCILD